jgi:hypothetical protein
MLILGVFFFKENCYVYYLCYYQEFFLKEKLIFILFMLLLGAVFLLKKTP